MRQLRVAIYSYVGTLKKLKFRKNGHSSRSTLKRNAETEKRKIEKNVNGHIYTTANMCFKVNAVF